MSKASVVEKSFNALKPFFKKNNPDDFTEHAYLDKNELSAEGKSAFENLEVLLSDVGKNPIKSASTNDPMPYALINEYTYIEGAHKSLADKVKYKLEALTNPSNNNLVNQLYNLGMYFEAFNSDKFHILEKVAYLLGKSIRMDYNRDRLILRSSKKANYETLYSGCVLVKADDEGNPLTKHQTSLKTYYDKCEKFALTLARRSISSATALGVSEPNFYVNRNMKDAVSGITPMQYYHRRGLLAYIQSIDPTAIKITPEGNIYITSLLELMEKEEFALLKKAYTTYQSALNTLIEAAGRFSHPATGELYITTFDLHIYSTVAPDVAERDNLIKAVNSSGVLNKYHVKEFGSYVYKEDVPYTLYNYSVPVNRSESYLAKYSITLDELQALVAK